jgi:DNA-binding NarL/FixJ family response regulator
MRPAVEQISVWLVEDNAEFRKSVARALNRMPSLKCAAAFSRGDLAIEEARSAHRRSPHPDVLLLDLGLPGVSGFDVIEQFHSLSPSTRVLVLTVFEDEQKIFRAVCLGAAGYLLKSAALGDIARAIQEVHAGGAPMTPRVARKVLERFAQTNAPASDVSLSPRERQILELMVEGCVNKEIADRLSVSIHTVDFHLRSIYAKLEVNNRSEAVAKALKQRLV